MNGCGGHASGRSEWSVSQPRFEGDSRDASIEKEISNPQCGTPTMGSTSELELMMSVSLRCTIRQPFKCNWHAAIRVRSDSLDREPAVPPRKATYRAYLLTDRFSVPIDATRQPTDRELKNLVQKMDTRVILSRDREDATDGIGGYRDCSPFPSHQSSPSEKPDGLWIR